MKCFEIDRLKLLEISKEIKSIRITDLKEKEIKKMFAHWEIITTEYKKGQEIDFIVIIIHLRKEMIIDHTSKEELIKPIVQFIQDQMILIATLHKLQAVNTLVFRYLI